MLELNKVHFGDCLDLMQLIPDKSIDMILCDLPYGTTKCKWDVIISFDALWRQYNRIAKDTTAICLFGQEPFSTLMRASNITNYKYDWYWKKSRFTNFMCVKNRPGKIIETISVFYKKQCTYNPQKYKHNGKERKSARIRKDSQFEIVCQNGKPMPYIDTGDRYPSQLLEISEDAGRNKLHPTQKPIALCEFLIRTYTDEGALVLDNCAGSGTVGISARNLKRNFILIEKDEMHFETCKNRLEAVVEL